mmetsp:Transcript_18034/g.40400  ORF Transcript_18034/g.40400 Transcript_18034/m.40400 type:complete len:229 (-) Transcript_18034:571-1257(-)
MISQPCEVAERYHSAPAEAVTIGASRSAPSSRTRCSTPPAAQISEQFAFSAARFQRASAAALLASEGDPCSIPTIRRIPPSLRIVSRLSSSNVIASMVRIECNDPSASASPSSIVTRLATPPASRIASRLAMLSDARSLSTAAAPAAPSEVGALSITPSRGATPASTIASLLDSLEAASVTSASAARSSVSLPAPLASDAISARIPPASRTASRSESSTSCARAETNA